MRDVKKILALALILTILSSNLIFASGIADYRGIPVEDINGEIITKPTAQFEVSILKDGVGRDSVNSPSSNSLGNPPKITAYVGEQIKLTDLSTAESGNVIEYDLQVYGQGWQDVAMRSSINNITYDLTKEETINIYLAVKSDQEVPSKGILPWSHNGNHQTVDYSKPEDFPNGVYWYFTQVQIEVIPVSLVDPVALIDAPSTVTVNEQFSVSGANSTTPNEGATITNYSWTALNSISNLKPLYLWTYNSLLQVLKYPILTFWGIIFARIFATHIRCCCSFFCSPVCASACAFAWSVIAYTLGVPNVGVVGKLELGEICIGHSKGF